MASLRLSGLLMPNKIYDPRPVYDMIAKSLLEAIASEDWALAVQLYDEIRKLSEN